MSSDSYQSRRRFLGHTVLATAAGMAKDPGANPNDPGITERETDDLKASIEYPRVFSGSRLKMIAFPLGGVGAGSLSLGGRGQLRDWEIFNRADKGNNLAYALPSVWVQSGSSEPVARVLESRYEPPYEGESGLGSANAPGLSRLASAVFTGEYPLARIDFTDESIPARISLEAFSPFVPHEPDDSGLPVAILRYKVSNPGTQAARVSIAWSIDNPVKPSESGGSDSEIETRRNEYRADARLSGLLMTNPGLSASDAFSGSFAVAALDPFSAKISYLRGWPKGRWWNSPLLFWDDFSADGQLGPEPAQRNAVGALCIGREIPAGNTAEYAFVLAWHFPNRTPARCGWKAPAGEENTVIGNWYATRFKDAWDVASYTSLNLEMLERKTRLFASALRQSTLPASVLEAASANLSTLASTTCFRTADGEFHGFEGVNDHLGCCYGNCTHVWNYETATAHLFPSFARSLRKAAFGFSMDDAGAMHFRQLLPDGKERMGFAAADGQMGQIVHTFMDWKLSGDRKWLDRLWPRVKKALEFAWIPGGWDANRDGVLEGVQHNTYDVEFYGPNPQCGIYYLAALRAGEEMARALGDNHFARQCRTLFESGSKWIDANLFNGGYYIQQVRPYRNDQIATSLRSTMGAEDPQHPEYQVGEGCLVDQLVGQYLAEVCGLGPLLQPPNVRKTLDSVYRFNYKRTLYTHDCVQRTFALNDESALVICDYAAKPRPQIPFPYFAEVMTGFEYSTAAHMIYAGMVREGIECIGNIRARYDGERRNPWDEAECGHHYARAMAAWSGLLGLSGFRYDGGRQHVSIKPLSTGGTFKCFWSTATAWGVFTQDQAGTKIAVQHGKLMLGSCAVAKGRGRAHVTHGGQTIPSEAEETGDGILIRLHAPVTVSEGEEITFLA